MSRHTRRERERESVRRLSANSFSIYGNAAMATQTTIETKVANERERMKEMRKTSHLLALRVVWTSDEWNENILILIRLQTNGTRRIFVFIWYLLSSLNRWLFTNIWISLVAFGWLLATLTVVIRRSSTALRERWSFSRTKLTSHSA